MEFYSNLNAPENIRFGGIALSTGFNVLGNKNCSE